MGLFVFESGVLPMTLISNGFAPQMSLQSSEGLGLEPERTDMTNFAGIGEEH